MPIASTDEQLALQASIREWAKRARTVEAVRSLEPGAGGNDDLHAARWADLAELGVFAVGLPPALGGAGGSPADLAAGLAQITESLVPGPVLPTLVAGQALARCPQTPTAANALPALAAGRLSVAVALAAGTVAAQCQPDGSLTLTGQTGPVLGGGGTTHVLIGVVLARDDAAVGARAGNGDLRDGRAGRGPLDNPAGADPLDSAAEAGLPGGAPAGALWCLLPADRAGLTLTSRPPADFSRPLADLRLAGAVAEADEQLTGLTSESVRDIAAALAAVEAAAVASWCTRTAAEYAAVRHQFGRPIGAFQAVKHLCASMFCRTETAAALAWDAARAIGDAPEELACAAAAAAAYALDAAVDAAKDCVQVLGGIGFTWEHDTHLYLRRALALRSLLGGSDSWRDRAAQLAMSGQRRRLQLGDTGASPEQAAELAAARESAARVAERIAALSEGGAQRTALADRGYLAPAWPPPYGLGASPAACLVIDDELGAAGVTRPDLVIGGWAIPAILKHGTPDQATRFAAATLRGDIAWCQLFSEPEAGSDLAALRSRADRTDDGWLVTGQKVWTSLAREADWAICLARTDAGVPKHKGLTYFLVAMDSPGIEIRPLREMTGRQMFNQVFLDQVFVPDSCVVGAPGEGWRIARTTLASERVAMGAASSVGEAVEVLLGQTAGQAGDPVVRQRLGALVAEGTAVSLLDLQAVLAQLRGADPGPQAAVRKLAGVAHRQAVAEAALELAGTVAATDGGDAPALVEEFMLTRCLSIAGGTTQILLSLVGERILGLPREEAH